MTCKSWAHIGHGKHPFIMRYEACFNHAFSLFVNGESCDTKKCHEIRTIKRRPISKIRDVGVPQYLIYIPVLMFGLSYYTALLTYY